MEANGVREHQIIQVRGYADNKLRVMDDPNAAANRRISVIVRYQDVAKGDVTKDDVTKIDVTKEDLTKKAEGPASPKPPENVGKK